MGSSILRLFENALAEAWQDQCVRFQTRNLSDPTKITLVTFFAYLCFFDLILC